MPCPDSHGPTPILIFGEWKVYPDYSVSHNGKDILNCDGGIHRRTDGSLVLMAARVRDACATLCGITKGKVPSDIASIREQKLQDENQALRDQIELLEKQVSKNLDMIESLSQDDRIHFSD